MHAPLAFVKTSILTGFLLFILSSAIFAQVAFEKRKETTVHNGHSTYFDTSRSTIAEVHIEIPAFADSQLIVSHAAYSLSYDEPCEQASWVAYLLTRERAVPHFARTNHFLPDPMVATGSADDIDYKGSGYDRGHLAPAADMGWSSTAMAESFYYSNMSPQLPGFNRGIWKRLEELVRDWAIAYDSLYVVTGPILTNGLPFIGPHHVSVPGYYYKAILRLGQHPEGIAFVLPNQSSHSSLQTFAISIDSAESLTGIDFFSALPDRLEESVEKKMGVNDWEWRRERAVPIGNKPYDAPVTTVEEPAAPAPPVKTMVHTPTQAVQCLANTKAGRRCNRMTRDVSELCWQHLK
jgi:endonuclease G